MPMFWHEPRRLFLILYDAGSPSTQNRIRRMLAPYAIGRQKSFFECWMTPVEAASLMPRVAACLDKQDRAHLFELDARSLSLQAGRARRENPAPFIVA